MLCVLHGTILARARGRPGPSEISNARGPVIGDDGHHGRLPRGQPRQLGRAGARARRVAGLRRRRGSSTTPSYLSDVVRFDLPRLGDIAGLRGVHLQCHIGTDTVSLARLGARMTGLDFSAGGAGAGARGSPTDAGADVEFVEADAVRRASRCSSGGRSTWSSPASARCAGCRTSAAGPASSPTLLAPGGRLFIREGHPMLWALDDDRAPTGCSSSSTRTSRRPEPIGLRRGRHLRRDRRSSSRQHPRAEWNHGLGEIVTALLDAGMRADHARRARQRAVGGAARPDGRDGDRGEWRLADRPGRLPLTYTLQARKPGH